MCGIVGIIGNRPAAPLLLDALKRLEYRGYDSAGIATLVEGEIHRCRAPGKLVNLADRLAREPLGGTTGIGHTRWATHGAPVEANAHPHATGSVAVVHNGIIENFAAIRAELLESGHRFASETDTEVVAVLVTDLLARGHSPREAVAAALKRLHGAFAVALLFRHHPELLICARRGAPVAIGFGEGEMFVGSDAFALAPLTQRICYLEEGDYAEITRAGATVFDAEDRVVAREIRLTALTGAMLGKGNHRHFMQKEICEQPAVIGDTLHAYIDPATRAIVPPPIGIDWAVLPRLTIIACGTSYHSAMVAKYWFERLARLPVDIDIASEFRYRAPDLAADGAALFISQSGETADTLAALRHAKRQGQHVVALVNQAESTMAREADAVLQTVCGPEIGVASTKAFTTQLTVLACLAVAAARARGRIDAGEEAALTLHLAEVPSRIAEVLADEAAIEALARSLVAAHNVLYLGRGTAYPLALEGALKLKELSYIHAEGYAAGEMKHGPIALIDETMPLVVVAPSDDLFEKTASNVQEAIARGGRVILVSDKAGFAALGGAGQVGILVPDCDPFVAPIVYAVPLQLLAYHVAVQKGTDVDQPRNLAKSVTVE
jgi:glucosamine--fructose-6-phosphate aminotransferase (isomerizing)